MPWLMWFGSIAIGWSIACGPEGRRTQQTTADWQRERASMVEEQLRSRGIRASRVLEAMRSVPRHLFVPEAQRSAAYGDFPLPIGHDQTISQPYIVAFMTESLDVGPADRVLEIGTGSGYQAAVLSLLAREVYTIEIIAPLADRARDTLSALGYRNVHVRTGNGYLGWPEQAPFDRIIVTAAPDEIPTALIQQLRVGGLMAIPVGMASQELRILRRTAAGTETLRTLPVLFVPMLQKPPTARPTIVAKPSGPPVRNFTVIYEDDAFLFAARHYGSARDAEGNTVPGLFVQSKAIDRWIQISSISTAGGRFGSSTSNDREAAQKLGVLQVSWNFAGAADSPYIDQPLRTTGSIAFPDRISYDSASARYTLRYFSSVGVPSAEVVLYIARADLIAAFASR